MMGSFLCLTSSILGGVTTFRGKVIRYRLRNDENTAPFFFERVDFHF